MRFKKVINWWSQNIKQRSTWIGIFLFVTAYSIYCDKLVLHTFLMSMVKDNNFLEILIPFLSGGLVFHQQKVDK
jgi:hypothetical protein